MAVVAVAATAICGCQSRAGQVPVTPSHGSGTPTTSAPTRSFAQVLTALGAKRVYVMAGDVVTRAGLGILKADSFEPGRLRPDPDLVSNVSGNGQDVVLGAAVASGGFVLDGVYLVIGQRLEQLAKPGAGLFGPTIAKDRTLAAIQPHAGFSTLAPGTHRWTKDRRFRHANLSSLGWGTGRNAYAVLDPDTARAQLARIGARGGDELLGPVHCARFVLSAPGRSLLVTWPSSQAAVRRNAPGCDSGYVITVRGRTKSKVPNGWTALAWSADSSALLLTRGQELAVWSLRRHFLARANIGVHAWMAAPLYR